MPCAQRTMFNLDIGTNPGWVDATDQFRKKLLGIPQITCRRTNVARQRVVVTALEFSWSSLLLRRRDNNDPFTLLILDLRKILCVIVLETRVV